MSPKHIIIILQILLIASIGTAVYFYTEYRKARDVEPVVVAPDPTGCPKGMVCKDFRWVDDYIEILAGEVEWIDCGEGQNRCARWEDYSGENPLPQVEIKGCTQQGTRLENGEWVTGLPEGTHTLVGTTLRPCEDIMDSEGFTEFEPTE